MLRRPPGFPLDGVEVLLVSLSRLRLSVEPTPLSCRYTPSERRWCDSPDDISRELGVWGQGQREGGPTSWGLRSGAEHQHQNQHQHKNQHQHQNQHRRQQ